MLYTLHIGNIGVGRHVFPFLIAVTTTAPPSNGQLGLPIAVALTGSEASDFKGYMPAMDPDGPAPKVLLADKGYDADFIREDMEKRGGTATIPTKRNRLIQLPVDAALFALRNIVERCFNKLKNARRLATRYDKTADSYLRFIHIVPIRLWTRQFVNAS